VGGTGLGLSVVYGILERHGGRMEIASAPMQGTTFTLTFQRVVPVQRATPVDDGPATTTAPQRLLVIDDEPLVRKTIAGLLRMVGHTVAEAENGPAGLSLLGRTAIDLVLTDLGMPGMNGWEVARSVKATRPSLPVVLLTGWGEQAPGEPEGRQHVDVILGKPVRLADLRQAIMEAISRGAVARPASSDQQPA
jgi:CheY-like chemotaxis protein